LAADFPDVPEYRRDLASSHTNLGGLLGLLGRPAAAVAEFKSGQAVQAKLAADFPTVPAYRADLATSHNNLGYMLADIGRRADAEPEYRAAMAIREQLVADAPGVPDYAVDLGGSYVNVGNLVSAAGDVAGALTWYTKAVERLAAVVKAEPRMAIAKQFLRNAYMGRAQDFVSLKRIAEALSDLEAALKSDDGSFRVSLRFRRADCLARLGRAAEAAREADAALADPTATAETIYDCACVASLSSAAPDNVAAETQATLAVQLLRKAVAKGYTDVPHLLTDTDLDSLRRRADYAALLWELADAATPPAAAP
jgi:tetratricopeptide (TPR) repeat protein